MHSISVGNTGGMTSFAQPRRRQHRKVRVSILV